MQLDNTGNASIAEDAVNNGSADVCGGLAFDTDVTDFDCADVPSASITLMVTDANGNSSTCTASYDLVLVTTLRSLFCFATGL